MSFLKTTLLGVVVLTAQIAGAQENKPAAAKVHDHPAFTFRVPDGNRSPAQRAVEAAQNLNAVIDEHIEGPVTVLAQGNVASVRVGTRQMFRILSADAFIEGVDNLADYAPQVQASLDSFLTKERGRSQLQKGVLSTSLVIFFGLLTYLLLRLVRRSTDTWEKGLTEKTLKWRITSERNSGLFVLFLAAFRFIAYAAAILLFLIGSLSLFERTEKWRDQLVSWVTSPFLAMGERVLKGLPNVVLLVILFAVLRGGWRALSVAFERAGKPGTGAKEGALPRLSQHTVVPFRLLARFGLIVAALLLIPLITGYEGNLLTRVGFVLLGGLALSLVPLTANIAVGTYLLFRQEYELGEWVSFRAPGGRDIAGEVTSVDFLHLCLVPDEGGEVRIPHLVSLWSPIVHLRGTRALSVEIEVPLGLLPFASIPEILRAAANLMLNERNVSPDAEVTLIEVTSSQARFQVKSSDATLSLRSPFFLPCVTR